MNYREYLHKICTEADMDDRNAVTTLVQFLLSEAVEKNDVANAADRKLQEVMTARDYKEWVSDTAREMIKKNLEILPDGDFKEFVATNLDIITDDSLSFNDQLDLIIAREESEGDK